MDNPQGTLSIVSEAELGWLGGMIDGEGTVAFSVYYRENSMNVIRAKPQIIVTGTDRALIERVADIIGRLGVGVHFQTRDLRNVRYTGRVTNASKFRPLHVVTVAGFKRTMKLLPIVLPHVYSIKRQKGEMMLRYMTRRMAKVAALGSWAPHDVEDLEGILELMQFSEIHRGKGPGSKYTREIEGLLRDITQNGPLPRRGSDDVVRAGARASEGQRRGGPARTSIMRVSKPGQG